MIANVRLPPVADSSSSSSSDVQVTGASKASTTSTSAAAGGYGSVAERVEVTLKIKHEGDVNKARHMPQNPTLIATKSGGHNVTIFDITKHSSVKEDETPKPDLVLSGHTDEGYGLAWSVPRAGWCVSGSNDKLVCIWDINAATTTSAKTLEPVRVFKSHESVVEDVAWHPSDQEVFASVSDDRCIMYWDQRQAQPTTVVRNAHDKNVNALAWNPFQHCLLATGGSDAVVKLWDTRRPTIPVHIMKDGHHDEIYNLSWNKSVETVLTSGSIDRRVIVWDISRIGEEQTADEAEDGPPELLFIHGGHTDRINDISWNPNQPWIAASVGEDNVLQIWQVAENIRREDDDIPHPPPKGTLE